MGRSRGGLTTKIHLATNAFGKAKRIILSAGHHSDYRYALALTEGLSPRILIADKGYDGDDLIKQWKQKGTEQIIIPSRSNRKRIRALDKELYKTRNIIERYFNKLKNYRRVATRYDKSAQNFLSFVLIAATLINTKITVNTT